MQVRDDAPLFSASDLVQFIECEHTATLGLADLAERLPRAEVGEADLLVQGRGLAHEAAYLEAIKARGVSVAEISAALAPEEAASLTLAAMREGREFIYQATFLDGPLLGKADFLRRTAGASKLGDWHYEPIDTKLARQARAKFVVQLCCYADLLAGAQGVEPRQFHLVLGDGTEKSYRFANYSRYYRQVRDRFLAFTRSQPRPATYPQRCDHCRFCAWRDLCEAQWKRDDYLNQVAGIRVEQIEKLAAAGIRTVAQLAASSPTRESLRIQPEALARLRAQAAIQVRSRETDRPEFELLPLDPEGRRGFFRLPEPNEGDVFFDMEGDPFEPQGLEYLFGHVSGQGAEARFECLWAHDRAEEKTAFESFMDFVAVRRRKYPGMHIYHYAAYEPTALKKLMSLHGTREEQVNDLLREHAMVDLYSVVREALRTSQPGLSIKDIECFYMPPRSGAVQDAGASIVQYERWRATGEAAALEDIRRYNEVDCRSTLLLRDWLLGLRPAQVPWFAAPQDPEEEPEKRKSARSQEIEAGLARLAPQLRDRSPLYQLTHDLLDFHRRASNPEWWSVFARQDMTPEDLVEDIECLGDLRWDGEPPRPEDRSHVYTFTFPPQETKLRVGETCLRTETAKTLGRIVELDEKACRIRIKVGPSVGPLPDRLSIGPGGPIDTDKLRLAVWRFAESLIAEDGRFAAIRAFLSKDAPTSLDVRELEGSSLFIQGPPGAGKTTRGSELVVDLLQAGKKVGITSNSHKAIHNLLAAVVKEAQQRGFAFRGAKKCSGRGDDRFDGEMVADLERNADVIAGAFQLVAGTAWLFADPGIEECLDDLFVDEAGQVSLANLVAAGTAARNIVLLGDQMQLGQPIQGVHPGRSGESTLDYLLDGAATVAPERGIFLATSWRMHPDVCRFVSDAVYDGKLASQPGNEKRRIVLATGAHLKLCASGIRFIEVVHQGCSQRSAPEADVVKELYESLLRQSYTDKEGRAHRMGIDNVLVVAPYNAQVNLLAATLPPGARVGTIDKFQGQEAEVVIVSMTTSGEAELPRDIGFLYSKNRLNVAISRAKCAALVVASPALLHVRCRTPEEMELVNTLCWLRESAGEGAFPRQRESSYSADLFS